MALPRANRLRRRKDFDRVYQKGFRKRSRHLTLVALRQETLRQEILRQEGSSQVQAGNPVNEPLPTAHDWSPTRVGISISQKVSKRAVIRNRIKRQLRAAMRHLLPSFPYGWNLVIVVHPQAAECDYLQFLRELEQLLMDAEVLNGYS